MKKNRSYQKYMTAICLVCLIGLSAGCGKKDTSSSETAYDMNETADTAAETSQEENETADESGVDSEETAADQGTAEDIDSSAAFEGPSADSIPAVTTVSWYDDDVFMRVEGLRVASDGFDALADALRTDNAQRKEQASGYREDLKENDEYTYQDTASVTRCDNIVLSFCREAYAYLGQSDSDPVTVGRTYDVYSGQRLALYDVITDEDLFLKAALGALTDHPDSESFSSGWAQTAESLVKQAAEAESAENEPADLSWCLRDDALEIIFHKGTLSGTGEVTVELLYTESTHFLNDRYQDPNNGRCHKVDDYGEYCPEYRFDADGDGQEELLQIDGDYQVDENHYVQSVIPIISFGSDENSLITVNGDEVVQMGDSWVIQSDDGKYYLYMEAVEENDYHTLFIYDLSDPEAGPVSLGYNESGAFCDFVPADPDHLYVVTSIYMMGTHEGYIECAVGTDGQLQTEGEPEYRILTYDEADAFGESDHETEGAYFTLLKDREEYVYDINGGEGADEVLKAGTKLYPYSCAVDAYMIFRISDGRYVTFYYDDMTDDSYERKIEGIPEEELFDGILYAG